jgi:hypothetical protein
LETAVLPIGTTPLKLIAISGYQINYPTTQILVTSTLKKHRFFGKNSESLTRREQYYTYWHRGFKKKDERTQSQVV